MGLDEAVGTWHLNCDTDIFFYGKISYDTENEGRHMSDCLVY